MCADLGRPLLFLSWVLSSPCRNFLCQTRTQFLLTVSPWKAWCSCLQHWIGVWPLFTRNLMIVHCSTLLSMTARRSPPTTRTPAKNRYLDANITHKQRNDVRSPSAELRPAFKVHLGQELIPLLIQKRLRSRAVDGRVGCQVGCHERLSHKEFSDRKCQY